MADKVLTYTVKVDGKDVEKVLNNVENFNERISDLQKDIEKAPMGSKKYKELQGELGKVEGAFTDAKIKAGGFGDVMAEQPGIIGSLGQSMKGLKGGIKAVNGAFKVLLANPIVAVIAAIVLAVMALYKAFASTKEGAEKLDQIFAGISAAMDVLRDRVLKVGSAIVKFFSGDFAGAFEDAKGAVSGIGAEIAAEMKIAMDATKRLQEVDDRLRSMNVERAKQNALISEAKGKINDETLSYAEREAALEEVRIAEVALATQEEALATERYNALKALADLSDSSKEQLDELASAEAEMYNKRKEAADKTKEIFDQQKALRDKRLAEEKAANDARIQGLKDYNTLLTTLGLEQIKAGEKKDQIILENEYQAQQESINQMNISEKKKGELLAEAEKVNQIKKQAITDEYAQIAKDKNKTDADELLKLAEEKLTNELQLLTNAEDQKLQLIRDKLTEQYEWELENKELNDEEKLILEQDYNAKLKDIDDIALANKIILMDEEESLRKSKVQGQQNMLSDIVAIAGAETAVGKAALVAKQLLAAKELVMEISKTITFSTQAAARSVVAIAEGTAQTAKIGFPQNIPMLIGYAAQAIGIISAIRSAVKSAGGSAKGGGEDAGPGETGAGFAVGGLVTGPGTSTSDSVPVRLSRGESVINARSTKMFGGVLSSMNQMGGGRKFASGGVVGNNSLSTINSMAQQSPMSMGPIKTYVVASDVSNMNEMERLEKTNSAI
tara:strand:+ start:2492 stop:4678 length:2187 start_codon:yes stop_codon:yes gene_type:complete